MYTDAAGMSTRNPRLANAADSLPSPERVIAYVDGLNLYYGLKSAGWRRYYWLDLRRLVEKFLRPNQRLAAVRYFTAPFFPDPDDPQRHIRQDTYRQALATLPELHIQLGQMMPKIRTCPQCGADLATYEEKMTDVNIAVALLNDAQDNLFDVAIIISADSDLAGPITAIRRRYPGKPVIVAFPPRRASKELRSIATASLRIGRDRLRDSQFPPRIVNADGYTIAKPTQWR